MEEGTELLRRDRKWVRKREWKQARDLLSIRVAAGIPSHPLTPVNFLVGRKEM